MDLSQEVEQVLNRLNIRFETVVHEPALTTEQADRFIEGIAGVRTKSMFLTDKNKTAYYLLIMDVGKRLNTERFKELVGANRIKMASADSLMEKMALLPGIVSVFGLLNNIQRDVKVYFDQEILSQERMSFHPNVNTKTLFLATSDVLKFVQSIGFDYTSVYL